MPPEPYSLTILVADGDPKGVRFIEQAFNTLQGIVFPREALARLKPNLSQPGVYLLVGSSPDEDENELASGLPYLYIGQAESVYSRISDHDSKKDFWQTAFAFICKSNHLNNGHTAWLEYALIKRAKQISQCISLNIQDPNEPNLSLVEKVNVQQLFNQILQALPLMGLHALEERQPVATPQAALVRQSPTTLPVSIEPDVVVVPCNNENNFHQLFLNENRWHKIGISQKRLSQLKYVAIYRTAVKQITHYAPIKEILPYGEDAKYYELRFSESATALGPILLGNNPNLAPQGRFYTTLKQLMQASTLQDLSSKAFSANEALPI